VDHDIIEPVRLAAFDEEDLAILSAHMQDAVMRPADMRYIPARRRFAMVASRFDWEHVAKAGAAAGRYRRRRTGLHFENVLGARVCGFRPGARGAMLSLLSITFTPREAPSGDILLMFSGNAKVKLEVECIEALLRDLGAAWETTRLPVHDIDAEP